MGKPSRDDWPDRHGAAGRATPAGLPDGARSATARGMRLDADAIIANAPDPVFVSDLQGKILQANHAVSELLGFRPNELLEQSLARFVMPKEAQEFMSALREVVERGVSRNVLLNPHSAHGEVIPASLNMSALRDADGSVIGAIGILRDMRAYEQVVRDLEASRRDLREANQAKDRFLATLSHELRTPLTAMLGWVRLLRGGTLDRRAFARALEVIERNTKLLAQLIEDLLDVSRIITGKLRLELQPVDPVAVVEAAIESVQAFADAQAVHLHAVLDRSTGAVAGHPERLQQVVWNLLSNGIKFTPRGGHVEVRLGTVGAAARLTVTDTGKGIGPDLLPYIFDRFRQGDSESERTQGLGLGLAIVRHFVELHGGTVRAESAGEGRGATFTVDLPPLTAGGGGEVPATPRRTGIRLLSGAVRLDAVRALVVEDEPDARDLLRAVLEQQGADVTVAASAAEALQALARTIPDVLISDIGLPGEDDYALIRKVRALEAERRVHILALAVTAYARVEDRARALAAGFQMHVAKPIDPLAFAAAVADLVAGKERPDASEPRSQ